MKEECDGKEAFVDASSNVGSAINAIRSLHGVDEHEVNRADPDALSLFTVPSGMRLVDLTAMLDSRAAGPRRIKGTERADTLADFVEILNRHKRPETVVWASSEGPALTAVVDYHGKSEGSGPDPAWCEHRVSYKFPFTDAFMRWRSSKLLLQREFLKFVQERAREITDPEDIGMPEPGTLVRDTMLDVLRAAGRSRVEREQVEPSAFYGTAGHLVDAAKRMSSKVGCSVKEVDRGLGGITVTFEDEKRVEGVENAREYYLIEVEVFKGSERVTMPARLRAEATEGGLLIGLVLIGVDRVIEQAFAAALKRVAEETGCPVYQGAMSS